MNCLYRVVFEKLANNVNLARRNPSRQRMQAMSTTEDRPRDSIEFVPSALLKQSNFLPFRMIGLQTKHAEGSDDCARLRGGPQTHLEAVVANLTKGHTRQSAIYVEFELRRSPG